MPRRAKGPRLYLEPERYTKSGAVNGVAGWIIRDGKTNRRTGCAPEDTDGAEQALRDYLAEKHQVDRTPERRASQIEIADVLNIYAQDVVAHHARPNESVARIKALSEFWGGRLLSYVTGRTCREYAKSRPSQSSARRELEDLRSAINHHRKEGLCTEVVCVVLPERSAPRERWLTRDEAAKLIWKAYRYREIQKGHVTDRRSRRHVARFILVGLYTGTRAAAICSAAFKAGPGQGFLDLEAGVFYRKKGGAKVTKKRQPPARIPVRLLAHLRRWHAKGLSKSYAVDFSGQPVGRVNKAFGRVAADAGLGPEVTPHVLRHTAATWMMQNGVDIAQAAGFLGMTAEILERVYAHHHPDFQDEAAAGITRSRLRADPSRNDQNKREQTRTNRSGSI